ncbi:MAG: energy transducer TonB family protein [Bacteroidales bacterium]
MYLGAEHKIKATTATLAVLGVILIILLWVHFRTPIPPYPEEGGQGLGLEVSLGYGLAEENPPTPEVVTSQEKPEDILTQDYEEADALQKVEPAKTDKKEVQKTKSEPSQPVVNEKALFKKRNPSESAENAGNFGTSGEQGSGVGEGEGTGKGKGIGAGIGDGISFSLEGRAPVSLIKPRGNFQTSGKVVVEITVDPNGNVINAVAGVKGSTTLDEYLLQIAREAALASKFSTNPKSTVQKGTITYRFVLQ